MVDEDRNFYDVSDHGAMRTNGQGVRWIGPDQDGEGRFRFRVLFTHSSQINRPPGGTHLGGVVSYPLIFTPDAMRDNARARLDFDRSADGRMRFVLYSNTGTVQQADQIWWTTISGLRLGNWTTIDVQWLRQGSQMKLTVNGAEHWFNYPSGVPNLGQYIYFGNLDGITGGVEFNALYWEQ